jgi:hypothetical protein
MADEVKAKRRAVVIGSQCKALGEARKLSFLPKLAAELYKLLVDPEVGACAPGLPKRRGGGLLLNPTRNVVAAALKEAFAQANNDGATLLVAMLGHGAVKYDDFFFLGINGTGEGDLDRDVLLTTMVKHFLGDSGDLNGLILWLDACHAGVAAREVISRWGTVGLGSVARRYEVLAATDHRAAYGGDFTRIMIEMLRSGVRSAGDTIGASDLREPVRDGVDKQRPQRITVDGGGWAQRGDPGLWLAKNLALANSRDKAASVAAQARVGELTGYLQPTDTLDALVKAAQEHECVTLTGLRGSGKSTLASALLQPTAADGHVPDGFVHAIAFATKASTMDAIASALAGWLRGTVEGFARAVNEFDERLEATARQGLPALERCVMGPLRLLKLQHPVRLAIDAIDEPSEATRRDLRTAIAAALTGDDGQPPEPKVGFVLTARPGAAPVPGTFPLSISRPSDDVIRAYLRRRGIRAEHLSLLVGKADGNWLQAYLLAEQAVRPAFDPSQLPADLHPSLDKLYCRELLAAGADDPKRWESQLRPVLEVCAAAGVGAVLPLPLAAAAAALLDGPKTVNRFRDAVVRLSGLIVRARPGEPEEQLGIFHLSLRDEYLIRPELGVQFPIDLAEAHRALASCLREVAPSDRIEPDNPSYKYALRAEAEHIWAGGGESAGVIAGVIESLTTRPLERAADELERWQRWKARLEPLNLSRYDTLTFEVNLANFIGEAGDPAAARDQYRDLLPSIEDIFPKDEALVLKARLADFTGLAGDPAAACEQFEELLPVLKRELGQKDPDTLAARANLARYTGAAGDAAAARDQYRELLPIFKKEIGDKNAETLKVKANLARFTGDAGNLAAARDQFKRLLPIFQQKLGETAQDTLKVRGYLARFTGEAGDPAAARNQCKDLLPTRQAVSGPEHPDTLTIQAYLADFTGEAGDPSAARDQYAALLPIRRKVSGPNHSNTRIVEAKLAHWTARARGSEPAISSGSGPTAPRRRRR